MKKNKHIKITIFLLIFVIVFLVLPAIIFGQETEDIIINKVNIEKYPYVSSYISFKEGSELGSKKLDNENFTILENNEKVQDFTIKRVATITEPIGIVLVLDTSGSMKEQPIEDAKNAASLFMDEMKPYDEFSVVGFADKVTIYSSFTSNRQLLKNSIAQIEAEGETSMFDGIMKSLEQFENKKDLKDKYIIILTDGMDTVSKFKPEDIISKAKEEEVTIYSVALMSYDFNPIDIENISSETNGELLTATDSTELKDLYSAISRKIRNQYVISYTSLWPNTETIDINITVNDSGLTSSVSTIYKNPFYTPPPTDIVASPAKSPFLAIFDIWWMKLVLYIIILIGITLFLFSLILIILPSQNLLKRRTDFYDYNKTYKYPEEEFDKNKGKIKIFNRIVKIISKVASRRGFIELFNLRLQKAGMSIRASEFITLHIMAVITLSVGIYLLTKNLLLTLVLVMVIILAPFILLNFKASVRVKKLNEQLPDTLQLISSSLKAGYSLSQSINMIIDEASPPISDEFKIVLSEIRMGLPEKDALERMAKRINSELFDWTALAVSIQSEVGGNLAEVMDTISDTIRDRERTLRQIKALTAEGRISAYILIGLPIIMTLVLVMLNREYISLLITTKIGLAMLSVASILMITGIIWILKIINVKY
jgi:tight adherence protein B